MKILQINKFFFEQGGAEHYVFGISRILEQHGHRVIPFAMQHPDNISSAWSEYFPSFVETLNAKFSGKNIKTVGRIFYSFEAKRKLAKLIKKEKPDIAHIHNIYHQISPSILSLLKKYQIPVVMTVHDYKLICPNYILYTKNSACTRCKKYRYYNAVKNKCLKDSYLVSGLVALEMYFHKLMRFYEKNVDIFICPSEFVKNKLVEFGFNQKKILALPHFVEVENVHPDNEKNEGYFLYVGRLKKEKGVDILIKAMKNLPNVQLKIAGTGPAEKELKNLVNKLSLKNISFLGQLGKLEVQKLYQNSLAVIVPSRVFETFGLTCAESMAYEKPVIAANLGGLPELVEDRKTGLLFEAENPNDLTEKMAYLLEHPDKAIEMGQRGNKKVQEQLYPAKHYQELIKIYAKATSQQ